MAKKKPNPIKGPKGVPSEFDGFEKLLSLMQIHSLSEIEWETQGRRIYLKKSGSSDCIQSSGGPLSVRPVQNQEIPKAPAANDKRKKILSPFVGTFYRSASPTTDPYVKEGQQIKPGDVLCIVEAMKLMNEIESDCSGRIASILVENGQPVEYGEPLFVLEATL